MLLSSHSLANGMPFLHIHTPEGNVDYIGVIINAGARDESTRRHGLAHFVEHTIFKGTDSRSSLDILCTMEEVGGELNAYTTKEETVLYTVAPRGHARRAMSLLADLIANATFPDDELAKERLVVADEICSYRDIPAEAVYDDFEDLIFHGSQLGHNILGSEKALATFDSAVCRRYTATFFRPDRMAAVYLGPEPPEAALAIAADTLAAVTTRPGAPEPPPRVAPVPHLGFDRRCRLSTHQSHTVIGTVAPDLNSPDRHVWALMANMLGGPGMNSLLNIELREKRGLVYTVESSTVTLTDTGLLTIYFGCDPDDTRRCIGLTDEVIHRLAQDPPTGERLRKALTQYAGQMIVAAESPIDVALASLRTLLRHGEPLSLDRRISRIMAITPDSLAEAAATLAQMSKSILTLQ